jgi:hypothetical protein
MVMEIHIVVFCTVTMLQFGRWGTQLQSTIQCPNSDDHNISMTLCTEVLNSKNKWANVPRNLALKLPNCENLFLTSSISGPIRTTDQ